MRLGLQLHTQSEYLSDGSINAWLMYMLMLRLHSSAQATQEWAQLAANWYSFELGSDSEQVKEMERTVTHPHSHVAWESQKKQKVGGPEIIL